jgi:hypothetical protein
VSGVNLSIYVLLVLGGFLAGYKVAAWKADSERVTKLEADLATAQADRDAAEALRVKADNLRAQADATLLNYQEKARTNDALRKAAVPRVVQSDRACDLGAGAIGLLNNAIRDEAMPGAPGYGARGGQSTAADHWLIAPATGTP